MRAEIVTIGDELCRGEIIDTNSAWFAEKLWDLDIAAAWMTSCRDIEADIVVALETAVARADVVVVSGGLGATEDDLTVDVVAKLIGIGTSVDSEARERWAARYRASGRSVNAKTERQLRIPRGARVHTNQVGAAPGFEVEYSGVPIICMPGIPREVESIWTGGLDARLSELRDQRGSRIHIARRTFRVFGRGESDISSMLIGMFGEQDASTESIHYRVKFPEILIKLVVRRESFAAAESRLAALERELCQRLGWLVYGTEDKTLAAVVGTQLASCGQTVSVAESCTGGLLGASITAVPGSSSYFRGGVIAYSNAVKSDQLGVSLETIETHGAVSKQCAEEMAAGVLRRLGSDIGISITGVAGPGGGSEEKPVGTVWLAIARGNNVSATHLAWPGTREQIRRLAVFRALAILRRELGEA